MSDFSQKVQRVALAYLVAHDFADWKDLQEVDEKRLKDTFLTMNEDDFAKILASLYGDNVYE